ncbi:hypothetical protein V9T40_001461 [Parthenolecanium corni]|uniref:Uncharacterized protein n=1 Tax=Parthenolecanium corni TaxID=536013 RepID=A0AAN9TK99_9HEMI
MAFVYCKPGLNLALDGFVATGPSSTASYHGNNNCIINSRNIPVHGAQTGKIRSLLSNFTATHPPRPALARQPPKEHVATAHLPASSSEGHSSTMPSECRRHTFVVERSQGMRKMLIPLSCQNAAPATSTPHPFAASIFEAHVSSFATGAAVALLRPLYRYSVTVGTNSAH